MTQRRSSTTQMADLNAVLLSQNDQLKGIARTAQQAEKTTNNVQGELYRQRGVIEGAIAKNDQVKETLKITDSKVKEMRRRNLCIKCGLWIVIILLFAANIAFIIYKLAKHV